MSFYAFVTVNDQMVLDQEVWTDPDLDFMFFTANQTERNWSVPYILSLLNFKHTSFIESSDPFQASNCFISPQLLQLPLHKNILR